MISADSVLGCIERQAAAHAGRIAVISGNRAVTYGTLWEGACRLAAYLDGRLREDRGPVMVYGHKDPLMPVCFLGCAMSGRAYCPVDISMPLSRVTEIARALGSPLILATEALALDGFETVHPQDVVSKPTPVDGMCGETGAPASANETGGATDPATSGGVRRRAGADPTVHAAGVAAPAPYEARRPAEGDDTFYIIFTSGSTGKPKGVEISERALRSYLRWMSALIDEKLGDGGRGDLTNGEPGGGGTGGKPKAGNAAGRTFLNQAPFSFDLSVMDMYSCLTSGGTLLCLPKALQADMRASFAYMQAGRPEIWVSTPSFAEMCLADRSFCAALLEDLRLFLLCGERLMARTVSRLMQRFPQAHIVNTYGPTECTVCVTQCEITPEMLSLPLLPVGAPKAGSGILLRGGEMIITGDTLAKGYFQDEEKTAASFVRVTDAEGNSVRGYRTGDSGYCEGGLYYCTGRLDDQIKLHGYRIEPGDIESNLEALEAVRQAVCVPHVEGGTVRYIAAFVRLRGISAASLSPAEKRRLAKELRGRLKDRLPAYMVPRTVIFMDEMPVTAGGKLDRRALQARLDAPRNAAETEEKTGSPGCGTRPEGAGGVEEQPV